MKNVLLSNTMEIANKFKGIPKIWDGKKSIIEMKKADFSHWRQMEWIGFYFQFLCENILSDIMKIPGPKYGKVEFDGFKNIPWDFKSHAINTSSHQIIVNDSEATANAIKDFGHVGLILALGKVEYNDEKRSFQTWHDYLKGCVSKYVRDRVSRGAWSRLRKVQFDLQQISFIGINDEALIKCGSFQTNFRNSDGKPRRSKVLVDLEKLNKEIIYQLDFK